MEPGGFMPFLYAAYKRPGYVCIYCTSGGNAAFNLEAIAAMTGFRDGRRSDEHFPQTP